MASLKLYFLGCVITGIACVCISMNIFPDIEMYTFWNDNMTKSTQRGIALGDEKHLNKNISDKLPGNYKYVDLPDNMIQSRSSDSASEMKNLALEISASSLEQCTSVVARQPVQHRNKHWQLLETDQDEIVVYSAIFDNRSILGDQHYVRAFAAIKENHNIWSTNEHLSTPSAKYKCLLWYPDVIQPYISPLFVIAATKNRTRYNKLGLMPVLFSCPVPNITQYPCYLSLSMTPCRTASLYLPITIPDTRSRHDFGICVPASFGSIPIARFIEWFEFYRMLGVTEFNIYNSSLSSELVTVFSYYSQLGLLTVRPLGTPLKSSSKLAAKGGMMASLNDCMLRKMYNYDYIVAVDFDEIIIPYKDPDYKSLVRRIDAAKHLERSWDGYSFRNVFYHPHYPEDDDQPSYLHTMRYRYHSKPLQFLQRAKSFINPRTCLSLHNHYCLFNFQNRPIKKHTIDVNQDFAMLHHYRPCDITMCFGMNCTAPYVDKPENRVLFFKNELEKRINAVRKDLNFKQ